MTMGMLGNQPQVPPVVQSDEAATKPIYVHRLHRFTQIEEENENEQLRQEFKILRVSSTEIRREIMDVPDLRTPRCVARRPYRWDQLRS